MKTLFLHIGTPKTGTSAIQHFLYDNQELLTEKGICYPILPYRYRDATRYRNAHFLIGAIYDTNHRYMREEMDKRVQDGLSQVGEFFSQYDTVVLTDESIWHAMKGKRKSVIEEVYEFCREREYCLKVIVYLRRQDDFFVSSYRQWIRSGTMKKKWEEVLHEPPASFNMEYNKYLCKMADIIGKENLIVHRYEQYDFKGDGNTIQSDFLHILGLELTDEYVYKNEIVNPSFSNNYAEMKRILNTLQENGTKVNSPESMYFAKCIKSCTEASEKSDHTYFSDDERKEFMQQFETENQNVAEQFIGDGKPLFQSKEFHMLQWHKQNEAYFDDMLRFTGTALLQQKKEIDSLKGQIGQLAKQVRHHRRNIIIRICYRIKGLLGQQKHGKMQLEK